MVDDPRLPATARGLIADPANDIVTSAANIWEIAIKHALARGSPNDMPVSAHKALDLFRASGYEVLDIMPPHVLMLETLPPLHGDPFDRMLVAQAMTDGMTLVSNERRFDAFGVRRLW